MSQIPEQVKVDVLALIIGKLHQDADVAQLIIGRYQTPEDFGLLLDAILMVATTFAIGTAKAYRFPDTESFILDILKDRWDRMPEKETGGDDV